MLCSRLEDVLALLTTNDVNYAAACALDFAKPPNYYATFALRDFEGHDDSHANLALFPLLEITECYENE